MTHIRTPLGGKLFGRSWFRSQKLAFRARLLLPGHVRQLVKPLYRRLWRATSRRRVQELAAGAEGCPQTLRRVCIICLPIIDWEVRVQRPQHLLARLAARGATVYYLRNDFHSGRRVHLEALANGIFGVRLPGSHRLNMYSSDPPAGMTDAWLDLLGELPEVDREHATTVFVQWPFWTQLALAAQDKYGWRVIYDCIDEHVSFPGAPAWLAAQETALIEHSDLVLATSTRLYARCAAAAKRLLLIHNAGDFDHFNEPLGKVPLPGVQSPIIGYYGALAEWFDSAAVEEAARRHPEWSFVLIGLDVGASLSNLRKLRNIRLLGERRYDELPSFLHRFDVAVIPFKRCSLVHAIDPLKFYEYLSAGKPVVAPSLPELRAHKDLFYAANTPLEFVDAIERALGEDKPERRAARIAFARQNRWESRIGKLEKELLRLEGSPVSAGPLACSR